METILLLDDDPAFRKVVETVLSGEGYLVQSAGTVREGIAAAEHRRIDLLLTSVRLPDGDGAAVLRWLAEHAPDTPALLLVPPEGTPALIDALRFGADGCLAKQENGSGRLSTMVRHALWRACMVRERNVLREDERLRFNDYALVARDVKSLYMLERAGAVTATEDPVLIRGESGTGRELLARWIHFAGPRSERPFVCINCGTRPACNLITGERPEAAHLGTLYLDEVAELDADQQRRLARLFTEHILERPGAGDDLPVDIRVIAATCRDLKQLTAEGRFREDLWEHFCDTVIPVPPLRERKSDIPALARHFLTRSSRELHKREPLLTDGAAASLQTYEWPGNLRELSNVMDRAALLGGEVVEAADIAACMPSRHRPLRWKDIERHAIEEALRMNGGNRTRAARQLGMSLRTLQYRLKEWGAQEKVQAPS